MKKYIFILLAAFGLQANAQSLPGTLPTTGINRVVIKDSTVNRKWFLSKYSGLAAGFIGFKGGSAMMYSAPMGLQLNRMLNKNLYAFGGVEIAPGYINFNQRFTPSDFTKNGFVGNYNRFAMNPAAFIGMGYTNDNRSFGVQARMIISQGNYFTNPTDIRNFYNMDKQLRNVQIKYR